MWRRGRLLERDALTIEHARTEDAEAVAAVLTSSIAQLCVADHRGDRQKIAAWTANKTPLMAARWIADPAGTILVSRNGGEVAAVGAFVGAVVLLLYVAPQHRFAGHSTALLASMEEAMGHAGVTEARLSSTRTALPFYRARGWSAAGLEDMTFGMPSTPMTKRLT